MLVRARRLGCAVAFAASAKRTAATTASMLYNRRMGRSAGKVLEHAPLAREVPAERSLEYSGMLLFLGGWAMMFGALFFSYAVLRVSAPIWPPPRFVRLPLVLPGLNT